MATTETHESEEWGTAPAHSNSHTSGHSRPSVRSAVSSRSITAISISRTEIGILVAIPPIAVAFFGPLWGAIADSQGAHRLVLRSALGVAALVALACTQIARPFRPSSR